ncbi:MAG: LLM class oxidoreductase [Pseudomonadota bacterium]
MNNLSALLDQGGTATATFAPINVGYNKVFTAGRLSLGLVVPIAHYPNDPVPDMERHIERAQLAEALGFRALWLRDVPFNVPTFGDAGQLFDPLVYLGALCACTTKISLGIASLILSLRHPVDVAKAAHSIDTLSAGRLILGIASGDRPEEFPAFGKSFSDRGQRFRDGYDYLRTLATPYPRHNSAMGRTCGDIDMLPKPLSKKLPLLITGASQQSSDWIASHGDGWMTYPRPQAQQASLIRHYRDASAAANAGIKPVMEPLYVDLSADAGEPPTPIHLGMRTGTRHLKKYLLSRRTIGVNHVALNLRFNHADIEDTLKRLADDILPHFQQGE